MAVASKKKPVLYATVPRLWPGGTILCIGTGPSLVQADVDYCRGKVTAAIAVNDAYKMAPWAEILYACDGRWWRQHKGVPLFAGLKFSLEPEAARWPGVQILKNTGESGLERTPNSLRTGRNSGFQALNLACHVGAAKVILLGYDMQRTHGKEHWFGDHPWRAQSPYQSFRVKFDTLVAPLREAGVSVVNCSRETALATFPRVALEQAL